MKYTVKMRNTANNTEGTLATGVTKEVAESLKAEMDKYNMPDIEVTIIKERELNVREKAIIKLIRQSGSEWIGAYENTLQDFPEDSEEYKEAKELLNHDTLFEKIYGDVMQESKKNRDSHIRFAGKEFIQKEIERYLAKMGYGKENR